MKRSIKEERANRLSLKDLDHQFSQEVQRGLNCSPFEAKLLVETVKEIYFPYLNSPDNLRPGQLRTLAVSEDEPAGKPISNCLLKSITLTLDNGQEDIEVREKQGIDGLRRYRCLRITREALYQGALLTVEDLAYRVFNVSYRTILRDIAFLKQQGTIVPLRSTQKDIGRSISHKEQIVKLWLSGFEYSEIALRTHHSLKSVQRYVSLFKRSIALREEGYPLVSIAFLTKSSSRLIRRYSEIFDQYQYENGDQSPRIKEIRNLLKKGKLKTSDLIQEVEEL